ncbi:hypothetical protein KCP75_18675 [Salmonella enterica subsp. enterica]|nr:hypothetical protein KCP75_18675 [Salmonella enterica subsp. enterica]
MVLLQARADAKPTPPQRSEYVAGARRARSKGSGRRYMLNLTRFAPVAINDGNRKRLSGWRNWRWMSFPLARFYSALSHDLRSR